jgi:hypothetical protein
MRVDFAGARGPHDRHVLPLLHGEGDPPEGLHRHLPHVVGLADPLQLQENRHGKGLPGPPALLFPNRFRPFP